VEAIQNGAYSYLTKPFDPRELLLQIEKAMESRRLAAEMKHLKEMISEKYDFTNIVAKSKKMQSLLDQVSRIAKTDSTVYLYGESGTGKELIAKAIHLGSSRKDNPFVAINCAAIPENLLESELFGVIAHYPGLHNKEALKGKFELAHKGTIILDEIGDLPLSLQSKLLRVLQERQIHPLGGTHPVDIDVRVIVATNVDLKNEVQEGRFREDLYYRIHVIPVKLPSLREKKEDIPPLVDYFIASFNRRMKKKVKGVTPQAMQKLMLHNWPGNVRELENTVEFAMAMTQSNMLTDDLILQTSSHSEQMIKSFKDAKADFEKSYLASLLELTNGNVSKASDLAGKYRADFYNLLKKYDLKKEDFKKS
jgi:two-component system response regulator GlrR